MTNDFIAELFWPAFMHIGTTGIGGDGEPMRYRQAQHCHHFGEVGTFTSEEIFVLHGRTAMLVIEGVDKRHERSL